MAIGVDREVVPAEAFVAAVLPGGVTLLSASIKFAADNHDARRGEFISALADIERQRDELAQMWATPGELTAAEWRTARQRLSEQEQQLRSELVKLPPPVVDVDIDAAREAWPLMTLDEQRQFVRLFITRVTIQPATVRGSKRLESNRIGIEWRKR